MSKLDRGLLDVVVCSDVVARGIDLENLDGVISYDIPVYSNTYIHRVGRTARAGKEGTAVSLCSEKQVKNFLKMTQDAGIKVDELAIDDEKLHSWKGQYEKTLETVKGILLEEKSKGLEGKISDSEKVKH